MMGIQLASLKMVAFDEEGNTASSIPTSREFFMTESVIVESSPMASVYSLLKSLRSLPDIVD
jgi:hypothetical protein